MTSTIIKKFNNKYPSVNFKIFVWDNSKIDFTVLNTLLSLKSDLKLYTDEGAHTIYIETENYIYIGQFFVLEDESGAYLEIIFNHRKLPQINEIVSKIIEWYSQQNPEGICNHAVKVFSYEITDPSNESLENYGSYHIIHNAHNDYLTLDGLQKMEFVVIGEREDDFGDMNDDDIKR